MPHPNNDHPNLKTVEIRIEEKDAGVRLDKILANYPNFSSRSRVAQLFSMGHISLSGKTLKASFKPDSGDLIKIQFPEENTSTEIAPYAFNLDILFEDSDVIVVNKPSGLVVHPSHGHRNDTLVNALVYHAKDLAMGFQENRPGIVHRLDKDTSGILVVAKNDVAHAFLAKQFREKTVHRIYWALVFGCPTQSSGVIRSSLARHPSDRKRFASVKHEDAGSGRGKMAVTHFRVLSAPHPSFAKLECRLETGRTHQIRVHLSEMSHPILGDETYGGVSRAKNLKSLKLRQIIPNLGRIALHARELSFVHPRTKKLVAFVADWPTNLHELLNEIGMNDV